MYGADGQENIPHREWLLMFDRVINEVKQEMTSQGRGDDFIGAKVGFKPLVFDWSNYAK